MASPLRCGRLGPSAALLAVSLMTLMAATGCRSVSRSAKSRNPELPGVQGSLDQASTKPGDFGRQMTDEQRLNVLLDLAQAHDAQGDLPVALEQYQKALELLDAEGKTTRSLKHKASKSLVHRRMAGSLDRAGKFDQAETQYKLAMELAPKDPKIKNDQGYSYYLQGRLEEAEATLLQAAALAPDDARIQTNLGLAKAASGKVDEAFAILKKSGGEASAHANLGYVLASTGKTKEAREHFTKALQLQPSLKPAGQAIARLDREAAGAVQKVAVAQAQAPKKPAPTQPAASNANALQRTSYTPPPTP